MMPSSGSTSAYSSLGPATGKAPGQNPTRRAGGLVVKTPRPSRPSNPHSRLSDRAVEIVKTTTRFKQVTSQQILRLYFMSNSEKSRETAMCKMMERLVEWGYVRRLPRAIGGARSGSGPYVYCPPGRSRDVKWHTLDIVEIYVRLVESGVNVLAFNPEAHAYEKIGHLEIKPDALVRIELPDGIDRYWLEVDEGDKDSAEGRSQLGTKMRNYCRAYEKYEERGLRNFPRIVFTAPDEERRWFIESVVKHQDQPSLFDVVLFDEVVSHMAGEQ